MKLSIIELTVIENGKKMSNEKQLRSGRKNRITWETPEVTPRCDLDSHYDTGIAKIVIPTYNRAGKVRAMEHLSDYIQQNHVWLAVRAEEYQAYKQAYPYVNIHILEGDVDGVTPTRQRVNEQFSGTIVVIDDDVHFVVTEVQYSEKYPKGKITPLRANNDDDIIEMLTYIRDLSVDNPYGGVVCLHFPRDENAYPMFWNKVALWAVWFNLDKGKFDPYEFDYTTGPEFIEDVYMSIIWFDNGNDHPILSKWSIMKAAGTGDEDGGCNAVPDRSKSHNASANWLATHYRKYCYERNSPKYNKTMGAPTNTVTCTLKEKLRSVPVGKFTNKPREQEPESTLESFME